MDDKKWWCLWGRCDVTVFFCQASVVVALIVVAFFLREALSHELSPRAVKVALSALGIAIGFACAFLSDMWRALNEKRNDH
jgi:hypothetical protein